DDRIGSLRLFSGAIALQFLLECHYAAIAAWYGSCRWCAASSAGVRSVLTSAVKIGCDATCSFNSGWQARHRKLGIAASTEWSKRHVLCIVSPCVRFYA